VKGCTTFEQLVYLTPLTTGEGGQPDSGRLARVSVLPALTMEISTDTNPSAGMAVGCDALSSVQQECAPEPLIRVRTSARWITGNGAVARLGLRRVIAAESTIGLLRCARQRIANIRHSLRTFVAPASAIGAPVRYA
jgi:hypothetical protein